jgi:hypothetical protein
MDSTALGNLRNKLSSDAKELEEKLKEKRDKIKAIDLVLGMLIEEGGIQNTGNPATADNSRFKKMGIQEAILKCMNEPIRWWSILEVRKTLLDGGLKTKSKKPYTVISSTFKRLLKMGKIEDDGKKGQGRRFKIKESLGESSHSESKQ